MSLPALVGNVGGSWQKGKRRTQASHGRSRSTRCHHGKFKKNHKRRTRCLRHLAFDTRNSPFEICMRWTQTFIPTLKETPAEAEIASHKLLLRAGLVRKLTGGLYTFLPLGVRALRKVEQIVREEMDRAGALEVLMPALQPVDIWEKSGRFVTMSD